MLNSICQSNAVYDVTIAYKNQCPSFLDNVFGLDPSEVHLHIRRIPIEEIPISETKAASWLMDAFQIKDQLLSGFKVQGHFPNQLNEKEISTFKCLLTFIVIISFTALFTYFTLFSHIGFKLYVGLSCAYLSIATRFKIQLMPLANYVHAFYNSKKQKNA
jgi:lysocardiolipin and lysophospholipid acyltransferase